MRSASTRLTSHQKIIPIFPENLYKSLEYLIKRMIALRSRATYSEVTNFVLQPRHRSCLGDFKIQPTKLNRKHVGRALGYLCREKKVIRKQRYFETPLAPRDRSAELGGLKAATILLVGSSAKQS